MKNKFWLGDPEEHDFPAALDYLSLLYPHSVAEDIVNRLKTAETIKKKAKDILRASGLPLLAKDNIHVKQDLQKVKGGRKMSPVLLVRDSRLVIADGYHRVCAIYYLSEDIEVPCRIADKSSN